MQSRSSLYALVGLAGLFGVVWESAPLTARLLAMPYLLPMYKAVLSSWSSLEELREEHRYRAESSAIFRIARPRYHRVRHVLRERYGVS